MQTTQAQANYLVVVKDISRRDSTTHSEEIVRFLLARRIWIFPNYAPYMRRMKTGDHLVIYVGGNNKTFVASAVISSKPTQLGESLREDVNRLGLTWFDHYVHLSNIEMIHPPKPIRSLIPELQFIRDKRNYGMFLRGGLRRLDDEDLHLILRQG